MDYLLKEEGKNGKQRLYTELARQNCKQIFEACVDYDRRTTNASKEGISNIGSARRILVGWKDKGLVPTDIYNAVDALYTRLFMKSEKMNDPIISAAFKDKIFQRIEEDREKVPHSLYDLNESTNQ